MPRITKAEIVEIACIVVKSKKLIPDDDAYFCAINIHMNRGEASTSKTSTEKFDTRISDLAKHVLEESAVDFTREVSDANLLKLYNIFGGTFERALELYESKRVTRIFVFETGQTGAIAERNSARWLLQIQGHSGEAYMIYPELNFCPCAAFRMTQLSNDYAFVAKLGNLKTFVQLLRSVNFKTNATCSATENGLRVTVEDSKCMQGSCYIPSQVFEEFSIKEDVRFKINLVVLVECLGMFSSSMAGTSTSVALQLFYKGVGHPVSVLIEEDGTITDCSLKTQQPDELLDFHLDPETILNKVLLQTELLKDFLNEADPTSEVMELHLSPDPPYFRISTHGLGGLCRIELPHDSDLVVNFQCKGTSTFGYKFCHIKPAMKALSCASKVSLRTDEYGLLCFQYMVKSDEGTPCYVEYYISPVVDDDD